MKPKFLATGIGSMPFEDVEHAVDENTGQAESATRLSYSARKPKNFKIFPLDFIFPT